MELKIKTTKLKNYIIYILMIAILIASGTPTLSVYYQETVGSLLIVSMLTVIIFRKKFKKNTIIISIILILLLFLGMIINMDPAYTHYLGISIYIVSVLCVTTSINYEQFASAYINIMSFISLYSLIITLYSNFNLSFAGTLPIIMERTNQWHHIGIFYNYWGWSQWSTFIRNSACFREPGVWGCYSTLALMLQLNRKQETVERNNKKEIVKVILLVMGAVSSFSTTAIICLIFSLCTYFFKTSKLSTKKITLLFGAIVGFTYVVITQAERLFGKLFRGNASHVSLQERMDGMNAGIEMFIKNPFVGSGYSKYIANIVGTSANSYVDIMGRYGIIFLGIIVLGLILFINKISDNWFVKLLIYIYMLIALGTQNILNYPIFMSLCFYGYMNKQENYVENEKRLKREIPY